MASKKHRKVVEAGRSRLSPAVWCLVSASLAAVLLRLPFGVSPDTDVPALFLAVSALCGAAAVLSSAGLSRGFAGPGRRRLGCALLAVVASLLVSTALSTSVFASVFGVIGSQLGLLTLISLLVAGSAAALLGRDVVRALSLAAPAVLALEVLAVVAERIAGWPPSGTLANADYLAQVVVLLLPLVVVPGVPMRRAEEGWRWGVACGAVLSVAVAGARFGFLLGALGLGILATVALRERAQRRDRGRRGVVLAAGAALLLLVTGVLLIGPRLWTLDVPSALGTRPEMWHSAGALFLSAPVAGHGPDSFRERLAPIAPVSMLQREGSAQSDFAMLPADPHDVVLAVLVHLGLIGLAAVGWLAFEAMRARRLARPPDRLGLGVLLYLGTGLVTPLPLQTLALFAVVAGAAIGWERAAEEGEGPAIGTRVAWGIGAAAAVALLAFALTRVVAGPQKSTFTVADASRTQQAAEIWRADAFLYYLASWRWTAAGANAPSPAVAAAMRYTIERAVDLDPTNPFYALDAARVLDVTGADRSWTRAAFQRAVALFPNSPEANEAFADFLVRDGHARDALAYATRALLVAPSRPAPYTVAAGVYDALGDPRAAARLRERAAALGAQP